MVEWNYYDYIQTENRLIKSENTIDKKIPVQQLQFPTTQGPEDSMTNRKTERGQLRLCRPIGELGLHAGDDLKVSWC